MSPRTVRLLAAVSLCTASLVAIGHPVRAGASALTVDTAVDSYDGSCDDADCSLRDAIASVAPGGVVRVPSGFYTLSRAGDGGVGVGDLNLRASVSIVATGDTGTFIDASALGQRAFTLGAASRARRYVLEGLTVFGARDTSVDGTALAVVNGDARLRDSTVVGAAGGDGGGAWVGADGSLTVVRSLFLGNAATGTGGAIHSEGTLRLEASTLMQNDASDGGGMWASGATTVTDSTITGNSAAAQGGGLSLHGEATLSSVTIAGNTALRGGGVHAAAAATVEIGDAIVSDNEAERRPDCAGDLESTGGNVGRARGCMFDRATDVTRVDPQLRAVRSNGGPTPTMALRPTSPAIDADGDCGGTDQRGAPRDRRCDAGAYELVWCLGKPVDIVGTTGDDELSGGRGPDVFLGLAGDDEFQGSIGKDRACGGPGNDLLIAGPGNDRFWGEGGNDRVKGESGDDLLSGGPGRDRLAGGPGDDICDFDRRDAHARCEIFVAAIAARAEAAIAARAEAAIAARAEAGAARASAAT
jgi:CSLREA domain-containing protein